MRFFRFFLVFCAIQACCWGVAEARSLKPVSPFKDQSVVFSSIPTKTYGDLPFQLQASASSGLPVNLAVSRGPAKLNGSVLTITGAGSVTVKAFQAGNSAYKTAQTVERTFRVNQASLLAKADSPAVAVGAPLPSLNISYTGFVNGDGPDVLDQKPKASTKVKNTSKAGSFPITLSGGKDNNYKLVLKDGTLTVYIPAPSYSGGAALYAGSYVSTPNYYSGAVVSVGSSPGLIKASSGTLQLGGQNTYSGNFNSTTVPGTLQLSPAFALQTQPASVAPILSEVVLTVQMVAGVEVLPAGVKLLGDYKVKSWTNTDVFIEGDLTIQADLPFRLAWRLHVDGDLLVQGSSLVLVGPGSGLHCTGQVVIVMSDKVEMVEGTITASTLSLSSNRTDILSR